MNTEYEPPTPSDGEDFRAMEEADNFSIQMVLTKYLRDQHNKEIRDNTNFRASDMGTCYLKRYWARQGKIGLGISDRMLRVFAVGNKFHDFIQEITKAEKLSVFSEELLELKDDAGKVLLSGHPDDVLKTPSGKLVFYDYKTVHSKKFHYLIGGERDKHYEKQVLAYYLMLRQTDTPLQNLSDLRLLYISKDDLCVKEISVSTHHLDVKAVEKEIDEINGYWSRKEEPKPIPVSDWDCDYCDYADTCETGICRSTTKEAKKSSTKTMKL